MASEADTRHGPLGILLAQARAEKFTYFGDDYSSILSFDNIRSACASCHGPWSPGASPPRTCVPGGKAAVGSR